MYRNIASIEFNKKMEEHREKEDKAWELMEKLRELIPEIYSFEIKHIIQIKELLSQYII